MAWLTLPSETRVTLSDSATPASTPYVNAMGLEATPEVDASDLEGANAGVSVCSLEEETSTRNETAATGRCGVRNLSRIGIHPVRTVPIVPFRRTHLDLIQDDAARLLDIEQSNR